MKRAFAVVLAAIFACAIVAFASGSNTIGVHNGVVTACVEKGNLKLWNCPSGAHTVSWNVKGQKGDPGSDGAPGSQGPKGDPGATGATGAAGQSIVGPQGPKGDTGATGAAGPKGDKGDTGATGPAGPAGADSTVPGPQGPKGDKGDTGATGPKGDTGATGPAGPAGADSTVPGPQGPPGPAGQDAPVYFGVAEVFVERGGSTSPWAVYSTRLGSPVGDTTGGVFRFTCAADKAPCQVSIQAAALGTNATVYPRILLYREDLSGGPESYCEYGDGSTQAQPLALSSQPVGSNPSLTPVPFNIGGSADCGYTESAGDVNSYIVPAGYYDVQSTFVFKTS